MFVGIGLFGLIWTVWYHRIGTPLSMGEGFMPTIVSGLLVLLGLGIVFRSFSLEGAPVPPFRWRAIIIIPAAAVLYGYLLEPLGLFAVTIILVVVARLGGPDFRWRESLLLGIGLAIFSVAVFVLGLSMPLPVWPTVIGS